MDKVLSVNIDKELFDHVKSESETIGVDFDVLVNKIIQNGIKYTSLVGSGGAVVTLPNPKTDVLDLDDWKKAIESLSTCAKEINSLNTYIPIPISGIIDFFESRVFSEQTLLNGRTQSDKFTTEYNKCVRNGGELK